MPEATLGIAWAAAVANAMTSGFTSLRVRLIVGIDGGVPSEVMIYVLEMYSVLLKDKMAD
jgi:hypothetical protein